MSDEVKLDSLEPPTLRDIFTFLDNYVVGEDRSKMSLFTNWILSGQNILLEGASSSGKTCIMDSVAKLAPNCFKITQSSDTAVFYLYEQINQATHVYIPELNKVNPVVIEILKDWGEGKASKRDVTVIKGKKGSRKFDVDTMYLYPKPFIFARADENPVEIPTELLNRVTIMNCDASVSQTEKVLDFQADIAERPLHYARRLEDVDIRLLKSHVSNLPHFDTFIHPAAGWFKELMPKIFPTSRRDFPRYVQNTYGIALFNYRGNSFEVKHEGEKYKNILVLTPEDMWLNQRIFGEILLASSIKCTDNEQKVLSAIKMLERADKKQMQTVLQDAGTNMSMYALNKILRSLVNYGYLMYEKEGNKNVYEISGTLGSMEIKIDWRDMRNYLEERIWYLLDCDNAAAYKDLYILDDWLFEDPFTGEMVNPMLQVDTVKLGDLLDLGELNDTRLPFYERDGVKSEEGLGKYL